MQHFPILELSSAPADSQPLLEATQKSSGRIPNLFAVMAAAPGLLAGYQQLHQLVMQNSFNATEKTVVWQTINLEHACHYCVPAHSAIAAMLKVDPAIDKALRQQQELPEPLNALRHFTLLMVRQRGQVSENDVETFLAAGYQPRQVLEIIQMLAQKVMSNYTNHLAQTPVDHMFKAYQA